MTTNERHSEVAALYAEYSEALYRIVNSKVTASRETIEDACQFAWQQLLVKPPAHRNYRAWLVLVAKREAVRLVLKTRQEDLTDEMPAAAADGLDAHDIAVKGAEAAAFAKAFDSLTENQQVALGLRSEGFSYDEIAEITGRTYTWVNRHVTEGRAALREKLGR